MSLSSQKLQEIFEMADGMARTLDANASRLREMHASIPMPAQEADGEVPRKGPLALEVFLPELLLATVKGIEGMAHNLRVMSPEGLSRLQELGWVKLDAGVSTVEHRS